MLTNTRKLVWLAAVSNLLVTSVTLALLGWNANGAHAAARNTARFSVLCFIVAFATPGLARWFQGIAQTELTLSFVAAHLVHYAVVAVLLATFERARLVHDFIRVAPIALAGFALVVALGFTASHRSSRLYMLAHIVSFYIVFIIFCLAFVLNRVGRFALWRFFSGWRLY